MCLWEAASRDWNAPNCQGTARGREPQHGHGDRDSQQGGDSLWTHALMEQFPELSSCNVSSEGCCLALGTVHSASAG